MSLGGRYAFATVMSGLACGYFDQLSFCVVCVDGLGYVYVCKSYVVLDQCDEPPPCLCSLSVHMVV